MSDLSSPRASWWSITLNNPNDDERRLLGGANPPRWLKAVGGQDEVAPGTGTLHIQGYCNTDQVRMSAIKKWLPRAHLKPVFTTSHIFNLKKYCSEEKQKNDSFVPGTQFYVKIREENERMTMADALIKIAEQAWSPDKINAAAELYTNRNKNILEEIYDKEYWQIVQTILLSNPDAVALYTQPQYLRAWIKTRQVWVNKLELDRQTNEDNDNLPEQNLC